MEGSIGLQADDRRNVDIVADVGGDAPANSGETDDVTAQRTTLFFDEAKAWSR